MSANDKQVGGDHYREAIGHCPHCQGVIQHWDLYADLPYLVGQATKYITRNKDGLRDLEKAGHFLEKLAETRYKVRARFIIDPLPTPAKERDAGGVVFGGAAQVGSLRGGPVEKRVTQEHWEQPKYPPAQSFPDGPNERR